MEKIKKPNYKELAEYFAVSESAVKKWEKKKRMLLVLGLWKLREIQKEG